VKQAAQPEAHPDALHERRSPPAARVRAVRRHPQRRGYTMLEVQVAFAVLGIAMAGLCPLVVMQLRQVRQLELRLQGQVVQLNTPTGESRTMLAGKAYYVVPWQNPWTRKLAGSAQILGSATSPCDPGPLSVPVPAPTAYPVTIVELDAPPYSQTVTVYADVSAP
jgi:type II secretory pathway pseudopilin PulG